MDFSRALNLLLIEEMSILVPYRAQIWHVLARIHFLFVDMKFLGCIYMNIKILLFSLNVLALDLIGVVHNTI